jgi:DNA-binding HxlR family transcriptional regulator
MKRQNSKCPAETTLAIIGGRWKVILLYHLFNGVKRFSELQRTVIGVSQKVLTQQLRELQRDGVVHREVYAEVPPRVEYSLTALGYSLEPIVRAMTDWGSRYRNGELEGQTPPSSVPRSSSQSSSIIR